jgi:hypothetical protein
MMVLPFYGWGDFRFRGNDLTRVNRGLAGAETA